MEAVINVKDRSEYEFLTGQECSFMSLGESGTHLTDCVEESLKARSALAVLPGML
jgi:hypothetical protein